MNMLNQNQIPLLVTKSARRRLNKKLRAAGNPGQQQQPRTVVYGPLTLAKTQRNQAKRAKKKMRKMGLRPSGSTGMFGIGSQRVDGLVDQFVPADTEIAAKVSVHKCLQNHFFPDPGLHRGLAEGSGNSAIHLVENSITVNQLTSTNNVLSIYIKPTGVADAVAVAIKASTDVTDPTTTPSASVAGPYNGSGNNPSTDYRVVHFSARLIPSGAFTNQAGEGKIGYIPDQGRMTSNWNRATVDNIMWSAPFSGVSNMAIHWVPNEYETDFIGSGYAKSSAIVGYIAVPSGQATGTQFRLDMQWGIEYYPTALAAKIVSVNPPEMHPATYYHFNKIARQMHNPLIVGTWDEYSFYRDRFQGVQAVDNPQTSAIGNYARSNVDIAGGSRNNSYQPGILGRAMRGVLGTASALAPFSLLMQNSRANHVNRILANPSQPMMRDYGGF